MPSIAKRIIGSAIHSLGYQIVKHHGVSTYYRDGLFTSHNHEFLNDPKFQETYKRAVRGCGNDRQYHGEWRTHVALWAAQQAYRFEGNFVECGVYLGFMSSAIMTYLNWNKSFGSRKYFLIDNFEGISDQFLTEEERQVDRAKWFGDKYSGTFERAKQNLSEFKNIEFVIGTVPDVLSDAKTGKVAFLHLDMNSAFPEIEAIKFFWPNIVPGGIILLDDYAYRGYAPQQKATDDLGRKLDFSVVSLPTGQGLIIR